MGLNVENEDMETTNDLKKKPTKKTKELLEENSKKIEELKIEKEKLSKELSELDDEEKGLGERSALKLKVVHKKFGNGKVTSQDGKYIEVKFSDVVKKFVLPGCIAEQYLEVEDSDVLDYYVKANDIHKKRMACELKLQSATFAIQRHEDAIEALKSKLK